MTSGGGGRERGPVNRGGAGGLGFRSRAAAIGSGMMAAHVRSGVGHRPTRRQVHVLPYAQGPWDHGLPVRVGPGGRRPGSRVERDGFEGPVRPVDGHEEHASIADWSAVAERGERVAEPEIPVTRHGRYR